MEISGGSWWACLPILRRHTGRSSSSLAKAKLRWTQYEHYIKMPKLNVWYCPRKTKLGSPTHSLLVGLSSPKNLAPKCASLKVVKSIKFFSKFLLFRPESFENISFWSKITSSFSIDKINIVTSLMRPTRSLYAIHRLATNDGCCSKWMIHQRNLFSLFILLPPLNIIALDLPEGLERENEWKKRSHKVKNPIKSQMPTR